MIGSLAQSGHAQSLNNVNGFPQRKKLTEISKEINFKTILK